MWIVNPFQGIFPFWFFFFSFSLYMKRKKIVCELNAQNGNCECWSSRSFDQMLMTADDSSIRWLISLKRENINLDIKSTQSYICEQEYACLACVCVRFRFSFCLLNFFFYNFSFWKFQCEIPSYVKFLAKSLSDWAIYALCLCASFLCQSCLPFVIQNKLFVCACDSAFCCCCKSLTFILPKSHKMQLDAHTHDTQTKRIRIICKIHSLRFIAWIHTIHISYAQN